MNVNENIIRNSLNESIDEFLLEEGLFGNAWNGLKNSQLGQIASKTGNFLKNTAAEYMNYRTGGQWNRKYGIYPSYKTSQFSEIRYLMQWFDTQSQTLQGLLNPQEPSQISTDKTKVNNYEGKPNDFIARECTYQNFTKWAGQYIKNYNGLKFIDEYIYYYITKNYQNPQVALQAMDINVFLKTKIKGQTYQEAAGDNNNRKTTTNKQELQREVSDIYNFFKQLKDTLGKVINNNVSDLPNFLKYNFNNYFNQYFKLYLSSGNESINQRLSLVRKYVYTQWGAWRETIQNDPSKANMFKNWIDYNQFFNSYEGKQYWYLQRQTGAYGKKGKY